MELKKIICVMMVAALLAGLIPAAFAAGSASVSGPSVVRAGDTITVSFSAGGGILGGSGAVSYDASKLTLQGYSQSIGGDWAVEFSGNNFVFYDNSMSSPINGSATIFTATFAVNSNLATGETISVTASGVTLSDGQSDTAAGSPSYSATIAAPLSNNCNLAALNVSNAAISPDFAADVLEYSASVPYEVSYLDVSAAAEHPGATVSIDNPYLDEAATTGVRVTVTAESGATKTYVIWVYRERDPNYVESNNANLGDLFVEGYALSPAFDVDVTQYYVWLPYEAETLDIEAEPEDGRAWVSVAEGWVLEPGKGTDIPITVTAEDGTERVYIITAVRAPAPEDVERYLNCDHQEEPEGTEPVTEPVTEPDPTQVPTEPEETAAPVTEPVETPDNGGKTLWPLILAGILCVAVGAMIGGGIVYSLGKKKK